MSYRVFAASFLLLAMVGVCLSDNQGVAMDPEMKEALQGLERSIKKETITEGGFGALKIGQQKSEVISSLQRTGVSQIFPDVSNIITITQASELGKISDANSLVLSEGVVWVSFKGNDVQQIKAPPHSELQRQFGPLKTRAEVFKVLADILNSDSKAYVRNLGSEARWVKLGDITDDDSRLLKKYDSWKASFSNSNGYWHLQLEFSNDLLKEIIVQHAPGELP